MTQHRRDFLRTMMAGAGWGLLGGCATMKSCQEQIANRPMRRNIATLSATDPIVEAYRSAVAQMKALPESDPRNWTRQARIHDEFCPHGNWLFLPWHRAYLFFFERICRKLSGMTDFALPYWNWSQTPSVPAVFWGGTSNPLYDGTRRATASSVASSASVGASVVNSILDEPNFLLFASGAIGATASQRARATSGRLESTPHNYVHGFVGGNMGNFMSPLDPIFWLHHNNIERCWVSWNFDRDHPNTEDRAWLDREFTEFADENGNAVRVSTALGLLYPVLSYRYDDVGPGSTADRESMQLDRKTAEQRATRKAKASAAIRQDVLRRFTAPQPLTARLDLPAALRLPLAADALRGIGDSGASRALLAFRATGPTEDFSVRVFLNLPTATAETPDTDPHFAGAFSFFNHAGPGHDHGDAEFVVDASAAVRRLGLQGGPLDLTLVLAPFPGRQPQTRELQVTASELRVSKDIITRTP